MTDIKFKPEELRILIIDDTPINIDVLRNALATEGYKISIAPNGEIGLKIASQVIPDLILLDIMMPIMDGFETCQQLKSNEITAQIPVIFITAKNDAETIIEAFKLGGSDYITKPFRYEEVCERVRTHLQLATSIVQLQEQNQELNALNQMKNKFLGMAVHDLRNPIAQIQSYNELVESNIKSNEQEDALFCNDLITKVCKNMSVLVNNLLDISAIENGSLSLEMQYASLNDILEEAITLSQIQAKQKNIHIQTELETIPMFLFDPTRITQVFDNLISNAMKFSQPDKNIVIRMFKDNHTVNICIKDEGPGLSEEDQNNLFKPFQKLSARPTAGEKSSGIGLAIVKKIIGKHQGQLKVQSELGTGSEFCFNLPLEPPETSDG